MVPVVAETEVPAADVVAAIEEVAVAVTPMFATTGKEDLATAAALADSTTVTTAVLVEVIAVTIEAVAIVVIMDVIVAATAATGIAATTVIVAITTEEIAGMIETVVTAEVCSRKEYFIRALLVTSVVSQKVCFLLISLFFHAYLHD